MNAPGRPRGECRTAEPEGGPVAALAEDPVAAVQAWRGRATAIPDPVRWCVIEALARRAAAQQGEARQRLILRVEALRARHAAVQPRAAQVSASDEAEARGAVLATLSELVDRLGRSPVSSPNDASRERQATKASPRADAPAPSPRNAVTAFKHTWSRLRAEQRLRQALAQVPATAGPLNSSHVMNRALQAMHQLSPAYLDAFMLHVDTLLWLEQAGGVGDLTPRATKPARRG